MLIVKIIFAVLLITAMSVGVGIWDRSIEPPFANRLATDQLKNTDSGYQDFQAYQTLKGEIDMAYYFAAALVLLLIFSSNIMGGCARKPYDIPQYEEIGNNETGFLIPLEGDTTQQGKFQSVDFLVANKVSGKRVQISHRWNQTGRWESTGEWISAVKLIKVDRAPVSRIWTAEATSGTTNKDQAIWVESKDSIGFSVGINITTMIKEEDTATFLYWYPSGSLAKVMDEEIHSRIQRNVSMVASKYTLEEVRSKKQEMMDLCDADVIPMYKARGITVTTIAMYGGLHYENQKIQDAIDATVIAQQQQVVTQAQYDAQQKINDRITLEANATAEKT